MQAQFVKQYQQTSSFKKEGKREKKRRKNHDSNETCHVMSIGPEKDREIKSKE